MIEGGLTAFGALLLVLGLLIGLMWAARRFRLIPGTAIRPLAQRELKLIESLALSNNTRLALVDWSGRKLLVSVGPEGARLIAEDPSPLSGTDLAELSHKDKIETQTKSFQTLLKNKDDR